MSGHGHQTFVDELARFAVEAADPRVTAIAERVAAPLRVHVSGRRGVGCRTVAHSLGTAGLAVTAQPDAADVDVYVIAEVVKPEDRAAIAAVRRPAVAVLNKVDLISPLTGGADSSHHGSDYGSDYGSNYGSNYGPVATARMRCAHFSALVGVPMEPMIGMLAVAALDDLLDDACWDAVAVLAADPGDLDSPDTFISAPHRVPTEVRQRLLDTLDLFGIALAVAAVGRGRSARELRALLRRLSGVDAVVDRVTVVGAEAHYRRVLDAVIELDALAVTHGRIAEFLCRDDTVIARMAAAVDVVEAAGLHVDSRDDPATHLPRAVRWQRYSRGPVSALHRACGADIARGSLRLWSRAGGCGNSR